MSTQITALTTPPSDDDGDQSGYRVNQPPPWWKPADQRCLDTADRLGDWIADVYRPVYGYLADLLAPCWRRHPLCLAYLDVLHEAWCFLYLSPRDPKWSSPSSTGSTAPCSKPPKSWPTTPNAAAT
jgi:hypothetical protein